MTESSSPVDQPEKSRPGTTPKPELTVVIVTYQSRTTIGPTLDGLQVAYNNGLVKVIVVDNASDDETVDFIAKCYPWVTLVPNSTNVGFGQGCNIGFKHIATQYVLLLNPDAVVDAKTLAVLVGFMDRTPRAGICGPAVIEPSGALQPTGGLPNPWKIMLKPLMPRWASQGQRQVVPGEKPTVTDWICGAVMLLRWRMIEEIGQFDPRFFLYFEETDLCYRAQRAGWEVWTVGEAVANHVNAASAKATETSMMGGAISEHYFKSRFYFMTKHFGRPTAIMAELGELFFMVPRAIVDLVRGRSIMSLGQRLRAPILKLPDNSPH